MPPRHLLCVGLLGLSVVGVSAAPIASFGDGSFDLSSYEIVEDRRPVANVGTHTPTQEPSGGNPGAWLRVRIVPMGTQIVAGYLYRTATWNPATQGAFASIDYEEDSICFDAAASQCMSTGLFIRQGGDTFIARASFVPGTTWTRRRRSGIKPGDFSRLTTTGALSQPDFSASAPTPLELGFYRAKSGGGGEETGIDDWLIRLSPPCTATADCDDADACTTDTCDGGICNHTALPCDDGDSCTTDTCTGGVCTNAPMDCNDDRDCTTDQCVAGTCRNTIAADFDLVEAKITVLLNILAGPACDGQPLAKKIARKLKRKLAPARAKVAKADDATKARAVAALLTNADKRLSSATALLTQAVQSGLVPPACGAEQQGVLDELRQCVSALPRGVP